MPRIKVDYEFDIELIDTNKPVQSGHWYTMETIEEIQRDVTLGKEYIVQEYSPVERELKHVRLDAVWPEKIMGKVTSAKIVDGKLIMHVKCASNKNGKKLKAICDSLTLEKMRWFPVGYANVETKDGKACVCNYRLIYIAF